VCPQVHSRHAEEQLAVATGDLSRLRSAHVALERAAAREEHIAALHEDLHALGDRAGSLSAAAADAAGAAERAEGQRGAAEARFRTLARQARDREAECEGLRQQLRDALVRPL
jgi:chromosome segregation ATPase